MEEDKINIDDFIEAGKIASKVREESKSLIMPGERLLDVAETIEQMIGEEGAKLAFPTNISVNSLAAHFTPDARCEIVFGDDDVVKVDLGTDINGGLGDTAYTIDLSDKNENLLKASREALESAISIVKPGVAIGKIGEVIEDKIKSYGFKPISNLAGHKITTGILHSGIDIPNIKTDDPYQLQEGEVYAIEPFASTGSGFVSDLDQIEIFGLYSFDSVKMRQSKQILKYIITERGLLPFSERWLSKKFKSRLMVSVALKEMLRKQIINGYPVLKDTGDGLVSQFEHTMLITDNGCKVLTK